MDHDIRLFSYTWFINVPRHWKVTFATKTNVVGSVCVCVRERERENLRWQYLAFSQSQLRQCIVSFHVGTYTAGNRTVTWHENLVWLSSPIIIRCLTADKPSYSANVCRNLWQYTVDSCKSKHIKAFFNALVVVLKKKGVNQEGVNMKWNYHQKWRDSVIERG